MVVGDQIIMAKVVGERCMNLSTTGGIPGFRTNLATFKTQLEGRPNLPRSWGRWKLVVP
jgi:hypothetical protein